MPKKEHWNWGETLDKNEKHLLIWFYKPEGKVVWLLRQIFIHKHEKFYTKHLLQRFTRP